MKFGIIFANVGPYVQPDGAIAMGTLAEQHGFDSAWTVEHVVVPAGYESEYPYSPTGRMPGPEESPIPDPLIWLTWVAAATTTLRLATGILILPQRNPVVLAKELATLDRALAADGSTLGVGVGWLRRSSTRSGSRSRSGGPAPTSRSRRCGCCGARTSPRTRARTRTSSRPRAIPKPVQDPIPIHVGGHTKAAARRAGRLGDGFFPGRSTVEDLAPLLEEMRTAAKEAGRDPDAIEVSAGGAFDLDERRAVPRDRRRPHPDPAARRSTRSRSTTQLGQFAENVVRKVG